MRARGGRALHPRIRVHELNRLASIVIFSDVTCDTIGVPHQTGAARAADVAARVLNSF
ncbi:hypothetical protein PT2222_170126 [Paraburkholderia tropica]